MRRQSSFTHILIGIICLLILIIAAVTIYYFPGRPAGGLQEKPAEAHRAAGSGRTEKTFSGIGTLRAQLKKEKDKALPATVVIEPYFSYDSSDRAFSEELVKNTKNFRESTVRYFQELEAGSGILRNDALLQRELLEKYNSFLHLGKIDALYFTTFMVID